MRLIVEVRAVQEIPKYTKEIRQKLETCLESIEEVVTAQFDPQVMKVYIKYNPWGTRGKKDDDDEGDVDINRTAFLRAVNRSKFFQFVSVSK